MADTATILYGINGTTKKLKVEGPHIDVQTFPEGPGLGARVTVHASDGGPVIRAISFTTAYIIDRRTKDPDPEAIR